MKKIKYGLAIVCLNILFCRASEIKNSSISTLSIYFKYDNMSIPDSLKIEMFLTGNLKDKSKEYLVKADRNGNFHLQNPNFNTPILYTIQSYTAKKPKYLGTYFIEPNDKVTMEIYETKSADSLVFLGTSSGKYKIIQKLDQDYEEYRRRRRYPYSFKTEKDVLNNLNFIAKLTEEFNKRKLKILNDKNLHINDRILSIIKLDYNNYDLDWKFEMHEFLTNYCKTSESLQNLVRYQYKLNKERYTSKPNSNGVSAPRYITSLAMDIKYDLLFETDSGQIDLKDYYNQIKSSQTGLLKEKLLYEFIINPRLIWRTKNYSPIRFDSLIIDAGKYLTFESGKNFVNQYTKFRNGAGLYNGKFIDLKGDSLDIKTLKGKVVLIDIWAEGCAGCIVFQKMFKQKIWPTLKDNPEFAVLSICLNTKKSIWLRSLETGKYSSENYINVSTGTSGISNPFLKYYDINSIPYLMLIDKSGNIIANINGSAESIDILGAINSALK